MTVASGGFTIRRAGTDDVNALANAHLDSIRTIGPHFYPSHLVDAWSAGVKPSMYLSAMTDGEVFFVAVADGDRSGNVLGFSSHGVDAGVHGVSAYVRGSAARRGVGTALLQVAEAHARKAGAAAIEIESSLPGVAFYAANGFVEIGPTDAIVIAGHAIPCVRMRKAL